MQDKLRVLLGESPAGGPGTETLVMLETNVDDMSPEVHGYVVERLLGAGALDAYLTPVLMKKGRPGVVISVLCRPDDAAEFSERACSRGALGRFPALDIMPLALAHAQKLTKYGA